MAIDHELGASTAATDGHPTVILAKTVKGKGFPEIEDKPNWRGKALAMDMAERAVKTLARR